MKIVMTLLVRDEADILAANIEYHLSQGVDFFVAADNLSEDATRDILESYARQGVLRYWEEKEDNYDQENWVNKLATAAREEHSADWIINCDADEFWWPETGTIKEFLLKAPKSVKVYSAERYNFIPRPLPERSFFADYLTVREKVSLNMAGTRMAPKVCYRALSDITATMGSHSVKAGGKPLKAKPAASISVFHFPVRAAEKYRAKIIKGVAAFDRNPKLGPTSGVHWRALKSIEQAGQFDEHLRAMGLDEAALAARLKKGEVLEDERLKNFFDGSWPLNTASGSYKVKQLISEPASGEGIVTCADEHYFPGLEMLYRSIQQSYPLPVVCFDIGISEEQRERAKAKYPKLQILQLPGLPILKQIEKVFSKEPAPRKEGKRIWPIWLCPFLLACSPFRRVFWFDCDTVILDGLRKLFSFVNDGPVFTPESLAPERSANKPELYEELPISRDYDPHGPPINGGISGWDLVRDRAILENYMYPIAVACENRKVRAAISWQDQGALLWAIQKNGLEGRVLKTPQWNFAAHHLRDRIGGIPWDDSFLANLRRGVSQASVLHWNGTKVPWLT